MKIGRNLEIRHSWLLFGPWACFALGFAMNATVVALNHGQMPVQYPAGSQLGLSGAINGDNLHTAMTSATHLKFLADWILINGLGIASPGDFLEWAHDVFATPCLAAWVALQCVKG